MFTWNNPYVLAVIIGVASVVLFHYDQKKKQQNDSEFEVDKLSYIKIFVLVTGSIMLFNYFVLSTSSPTPTNPESIVSEIVEKVIPSPIPSPVPNKALQHSVTGSAFTPISSHSISGLKIKEGPPNF